MLAEPISQTICDLIRHWTERDPDKPAFVAEGQAPLTYGALAQLMDDFRLLNPKGYGMPETILAAKFSGRRPKNVACTRTPRNLRTRRRSPGKTGYEAPGLHTEKWMASLPRTLKTSRSKTGSFLAVLTVFTVFFDTRPIILSAARRDVLHGPRDWQYFNQLGYEVSGSAVATYLG